MIGMWAGFLRKDKSIRYLTISKKVLQCVHKIERVFEIQRKNELSYSDFFLKQNKTKLVANVT